MSGKTKFILIFSERLRVGELSRECIDNFAADFRGCLGKCRDIGCMSQQMKQKMTYK